MADDNVVEIRPGVFASQSSISVDGPSDRRDMAETMASSFCISKGRELTEEDIQKTLAWMDECDRRGMEINRLLVAQLLSWVAIVFAAAGIVLSLVFDRGWVANLSMSAVFVAIVVLAVVGTKLDKMRKFPDPPKL